MEIPSLETERLRLRAFTLGDVEPLRTILNGPEVLRYFPRKDPSASLGMEQVERMIGGWIAHWERGFGLWALELSSTGGLVGRCGLQYLAETDEVEIDYLLAREHWGRGLATEAAMASLSFGLDRLGLRRVVGITHPENRASQRVLEKIGMRFDGAASYFGMDCHRHVIERGRVSIPADDGPA